MIVKTIVYHADTANSEHGEESIIVNIHDNGKDLGYCVGCEIVFSNGSTDGYYRFIDDYLHNSGVFGDSMPGNVWFDKNNYGWQFGSISTTCRWIKTWCAEIGLELAVVCTPKFNSK